MPRFGAWRSITWWNRLAIARELKSTDVSLWIADGSNYPGSQNIRKRIVWLEEAMAATHAELAEGQRMLIEYKPFEPAFYHTDIADWGMASHLARAAGPQARVLVDTGHHYQSQNIEQIVAWLLHMRLLGGFHFNDRRYADDDLTLGSIDPYQVFRIFHEIFSEPDAALVAEIAFMIDQSHNLKGKMEAMVQTVMTAQELYLKASLVDRERLERAAGGRQDRRSRGVFARGLLDRCPPGAGGVENPAGTASQSPGSARRERLCGAHYARAAREKCSIDKLLRLKIL